LAIIMNKAFFLTVFICAVWTAASVSVPQAAASGGARNCQEIKSTAGALACVNQKKKNAQIRLGMIYEMLAESLDEGDLEQLRDSQAKWLSYRDSHCAFEARRAATPALERLYELSCIADLTEHKAELLSMALYHGTRETPREFGDLPRWMNVLAHDHPDIYWRYGSRISADLDCDGKKENILPGLAVRTPEDVSAPDTETESAAGLEIIIAISENPVTGKPHFHTVGVPLRGAGEFEGAFCSPRITLTAPKYEEPKSSDCAFLVVDDGSCYRVQIRNSAQGYGIFESAGERSQEAAGGRQ
jgi:uncharacterized protein YecT (DUF1311 family)